MTKELNQKCAETYYNRGLAHSKKGAFELAIEDFDKAIELNPNFAEAHYQRGIAYRIKGDYKLAIADYTKAIELNPGYAEAYYNRGGTWLRLGKREKAKSDLVTARNLGSDTITALDISENRKTQNLIWQSPVVLG